MAIGRKSKRRGGWACRARQAWVCICALAFFMQVHAQTAIVSGTLSSSSEPVRNAAVTFLSGSDTTLRYTTSTDSLGRYRLGISVTSVGGTSPLPAQFRLAQNYPNPFSSSTVVPYELAQRSDIQLTIFDLLGRVVRRITAGSQPAGGHSLLWDGKNSVGQPVANGVYFYRLDAAAGSQARKMVLHAGSGAGGPLPHMLSGPMSAVAEPAGTAGRELRRAAYTIRIENRAETRPWVVSREFTGIMVSGDTTIDLALSALPVSTVLLDSLQQVIRGFGAANIIPWRPDMTPEQVQTAFGTGPGELGFTILRLRIPYAQSDFGAQVASAKRAQSMGALVFASPWTPPPALKSSNNIVGGRLNDTSYGSYAAHLKSFADYMAGQGVPLYAVSLQNEPDASVTYESCSWSASEFLTFMRNNAASVGTRIIMPESMNFQHALSDPSLTDPVAAANLSIIGGHVYGGGLTPYPLAVSKGKEVWMTEHLDLDTSWTGVLNTGKEIHDCMIAGMNAYVWWYIVRYYGPVLEDGKVAPRGFVMAHYSRFVRPGAWRVTCAATPQRNVYVSAYRDSAGKVAIVALNMGGTAVQQGFLLPGASAVVFSPFTTSRTKRLAGSGDVAVTDGGFVATLEPSSIMTFVSH